MPTGDYGSLHKTSLSATDTLLPSHLLGHVAQVAEQPRSPFKTELKVCFCPCLHSRDIFTSVWHHVMEDIQGPMGYQWIYISPTVTVIVALYFGTFLQYN